MIIILFFSCLRRALFLGGGLFLAVKSIMDGKERHWHWAPRKKNCGDREERQQKQQLQHAQENRSKETHMDCRHGGGILLLHKEEMQKEEQTDSQKKKEGRKRQRREDPCHELPTSGVAPTQVVKTSVLFLIFVHVLQACMLVGQCVCVGVGREECVLPSGYQHASH